MNASITRPWWDARLLGFPMCLLGAAVAVYRGPRIILADGISCPSVSARAGIQAGCPLAPVLSKVALWRPLKEVLSSSYAKHADLWVDDVSVDVVDRNPSKSAAKALALHARLKGSLEGHGHFPSADKTFFLASTRQAEKSPQATARARRPGCPQRRQGLRCNHYPGPAQDQPRSLGQDVPKQVRGTQK